MDGSYGGPQTEKLVSLTLSDEALVELPEAYAVMQFINIYYLLFNKSMISLFI